MSDDASTFLKENLQFSEVEKKGIVRMIKYIHDELALKKASQLLPLEITQRPAKQLELLKEEIDNLRKLMIFCFNEVVDKNNQLTKDANASDSNAATDSNADADSNADVDDSKLRVFSVKIDESILKEDEVYIKILEFTPPLSEGDKIARLQDKTMRDYQVTQNVYEEMISKIKKTCEKILEIENVNIEDPNKLASIMLSVIDAVHAAEIEAIDHINDKTEETEPEDPCDANKRLGIDWSFLGIFSKLPEKCDPKVVRMRLIEPVPIEIVGQEPVKENAIMDQEPVKENAIPINLGGGNARTRKKRMSKLYNMPRKVVVCKGKTLKRCKRAKVSCKTVMGASRKYCRRNTRKAIAKYRASRK